MRTEAITLSRVPFRGSLQNQEELQIPAGKEFGQLLAEALDDVNTLQQNANNAALQLAAGKIDDISQVTIAAEKASLALQLTMQVRNKVVDAYQEVMRMQV